MGPLGDLLEHIGGLLGSLGGPLGSLLGPFGCLLGLLGCLLELLGGLLGFGCLSGARLLWVSCGKLRVNNRQEPLVPLLPITVAEAQAPLLGFIRIIRIIRI